VDDAPYKKEGVSTRDPILRPPLGPQAAKSIGKLASGEAAVQPAYPWFREEDVRRKTAGTQCSEGVGDMWWKDSAHSDFSVFGMAVTDAMRARHVDSG